MSDTFFFQIFESGSLVDLHTKFGGSNSKGRKKCHALGGVLCGGRIWANRPSSVIYVCVCVCVCRSYELI